MHSFTLKDWNSSSFEVYTTSILLGRRPHVKARMTLKGINFKIFSTRNFVPPVANVFLLALKPQRVALKVKLPGVVYDY